METSYAYIGKCSTAASRTVPRQPDDRSSLGCMRTLQETVTNSELGAHNKLQINNTY
jgi:hypothetical protein